MSYKETMKSYSKLNDKAKRMDTYKNTDPQHRGCGKDISREHASKRK